MTLPVLSLPLETRQVVANIVSNFLFGTRYIYQGIEPYIEGKMPNVKGAISAELLVHYKKEFSRWISLVCVQNDAKIEQCVPFDFFFFLQQQFKVSPVIIDDLRLILKDIRSGFFSLDQEIIITKERLVLLRFLGALQFQTYEAQPSAIKQMCADITPSFFPDYQQAVFDTLDPDWKGIVLIAVLLEDFEKNIMLDKSPLEQISHLLCFKNPKGKMSEDIKILLYSYGIPLSVQDQVCDRFESSIKHYLAHEDSHEALKQTDDLLSILYGASLLRDKKPFKTDWPVDFAKTILQHLRQAKETVGIVAGQIILPPSLGSVSKI